MADTLLVNTFGLREIDWSGGYELSKMCELRKSYIEALRQADSGNYSPLLIFVGEEAVD